MTVPTPPTVTPAGFQTWVDAVTNDVNGAVKAADPAGGDLAGSYPNPTINPDTIDDSHVAPDANIARTKIAVVEDVHVIGAAGEPAFGATWTSLANYGPVGFWFDPMTEQVWFQGIAQATGGDPGAQATIFTLPAEYRPPVNRSMICLTTGSVASNLLIYGSNHGSLPGAVTISRDLALNGIVYLDGLSFRI